MSRVRCQIIGLAPFVVFVFSCGDTASDDSDDSDHFDDSDDTDDLADKEVVLPLLGELVDITPTQVSEGPLFLDIENNVPVYLVVPGDLDGNCEPTAADCEGWVCRPPPSCQYEVVTTSLATADGDEEGEITQRYLVFTWNGGAWVPFESRPALWQRDEEQEHWWEFEHVSQMYVGNILGTDESTWSQIIDSAAQLRKFDDNGDWKSTLQFLGAPEYCPDLYIDSDDIGLADIDLDGWTDFVLASGEAECAAGSVFAGIRTGPDQWEIKHLMENDGLQKGWAIGFQWEDDSDALVLNVHGGSFHGLKPPHGNYRHAGEDENGFPYFDSTKYSYAEGTGRAPMGFAICDLDNDGFQERLISNNNDAELTVERFDGVWASINRILDIRHPETNRTDWPEYEIPWGVVCSDLDLDGFPDVVVAHGDDAGNYWDEGVRYHLTVNRNPGRITQFPPLEDQEALEDLGNFRGLVGFDFDLDGDSDLFASTYYSSLPRIIENRLPLDSHGLTIMLRGSTSEPMGIGAKVYVTTPDGRTQVHQMGNSGSPNVRTVPQWSVGLNKYTEAEVSVWWPSGQVVDYGTLRWSDPSESKPVYYLKEPPVLTVAPADRRIDAGSTQTATFEVCPWQPEAAASVKRSSRVEVTLEQFGEAVDASLGTVVQDPASGCWVGAISPASRPGSAKLLVTLIDEGGAHQEIKIKPRIYFE